MRLHNRMFLLALVLIASAGLAVPAFAAQTRTLGPGSPDEMPGFRVTGSSDRGMTLEFTVPAIEVEDVALGDRTFQKITITGGGTLAEDGAPELPTFGRLISIPDRAGVQIRTEVLDEQEYAGVNVSPAQQEGRPFEIDLGSYGRNGYDDAPVAHLGRPALMRGLRVAAITMTPVRFNPAEQKVRVAHRVRIEVTFDGVDGENARVQDPRPLTPSFDRLYRDFVVNYPALEKGAVIHPGTWLLICPNSTQVTDRLQALVDWRTRKGLPARMVTTAETGTTSQAIKNYIQNAYDTWTDPPEYIVLAGDADGSYSIPTWSYAGGEGDHPYSQLEGGDLVADAHVGRLSFSSTSELDIILDKIISYEKTPYTAQDPDWYTRACLVGDPSNSGQSTVMVMQGIKTWLRQQAYTQIDTVFSGNFVNQMSTALNRGDTFFCYRGYYQMSGWGNSNTYALTNSHKTPFAVLPTCGTGSFQGGTARSEAFLRAGSVGDPRAGLAAIGTATLSTHTRFNNCYIFGVMFGALFDGTYQTGTAHTRGKLELFLNYGATQMEYATEFSYWNNLMGDPASEVFTGFPAAITVTHPSGLSTGANVIPVTVTSGGAPVAGARVCAWKGTETWMVGLTDDAGQLDLPINPATAGNLLLTVTAHNKMPYLATLPVTSSNVYVAYQALAVDDDTNDPSQGNGDGIANPGETIQLRVQVKNFGSQQATGVSAQISTDDPYVTIADAANAYGTIAAGGSSWGTDDFVITVDPGCPHGHTVAFNLDITSGSNQWRSLVNLPVTSADLKFVGTHLSNVGNGVLDPGETGQMTVTLANRGGMTATAPTAVLSSLSEYLSIQDGAAVYPNIAPDGSIENTGDPFTITAAANTYRGYVGRLRMVMTFSGGIKDTVDFTVSVGTRNSTDPSGPDGHGYWAFDNTDTSYPEHPTYSWVEIDPAFGGDGTEIVLGDFGDYQDKSRTVDMPFTFQYYGQGYGRATVCSNGWIAMGDTYIVDYRNWTIPSAGGPNGIIAVFWDDLSQSGSAKCYQKYDAANHRWIVEWSHFRSYPSNAECTFQAIFLDPAFYPTESGDGEILFQYSAASTTDYTDGYFTTGIERPDNLDGLLWAYFNVYTPGSANIGAGRAIRFLPRVETLTGTIAGTVRNHTSGMPLSNATLTVLETGQQYTTGGMGTYQFTEPAGVFSVAAARAGFAPDTVSNVDVQPGTTAQIDFALRDIAPPNMIYNNRITSTTDSIGPYNIQVMVLDDTPLSEAAIYWRRYDGAFVRLPLFRIGLTEWRASIPGQSWTTRIDYYIMARDGAGNATSLPAGAPGEVYTFWVGPLLTAHADDLESDQGWTVGAPADQATEGIWERCDPNGTWNGSDPVQPEDDHSPEPGTLCFVTGQSAPGAGQDANDVEGARTSLTSPALNCAVDGTVLVRYWRWFSNDTGGPADDEWVVRVSDDDGVTWTDVERTTVAQRSWVQVEFNLADYVTLTDKIRIRFVASDTGAPSIVEAGVDDLQIVYIGLSPSAAPETGPVRFGFTGLRNPARPDEAISFGLERQGPARLVVYDVQGRAVRTLVSGVLPAGRHRAVWDGRDDGGHAAPSGLYFYNLQAGGKAETRKTILIR